MEVCPVCAAFCGTTASLLCGVRSDEAPPCWLVATGVALRAFSEVARELIAWNEAFGVPSREAEEGTLEFSLGSGPDSIAAD